MNDQLFNSRKDGKIHSWDTRRSKMNPEQIYQILYNHNIQAYIGAAVVLVAWVWIGIWLVKSSIKKFF
jgi:hypothetical protein